VLVTEEIPEDVAPAEQVVAEASQGQVGGPAKELLGRSVPDEDMTGHVGHDGRGVAETEQIEDGGAPVGLVTPVPKSDGIDFELQETIHEFLLSP
jgi:hypothetical protein